MEAVRKGGVTFKEQEWKESCYENDLESYKREILANDDMNHFRQRHSVNRKKKTYLLQLKLYKESKHSRLKNTVRIGYQVCGQFYCSKRRKKRYIEIILAQHTNNDGRLSKEGLVNGYKKVIEAQVDYINNFSNNLYFVYDGQALLTTSSLIQAFKIIDKDKVGQSRRIKLNWHFVKTLESAKKFGNR